ncbi:hypothetical protein I203_105381 [Kwoniella mangroviensis CBS 8507]|uniref:uncharacterized protein n=1 Tax=Kwoniella mangroviensis CBS 8507 TaxID=1296122 RepID=UPI00080D3C94|nr:uncharacterized protein I203_01198 [Kwoniella mangroviensis CBS 8507]OCF69341.1 hypothetical protein I203_01198 [Kwoniella mangroviensis CBS 8507]
MLITKTLFLLLPLLAHAKPEHCNSKSASSTATAPLNQALVATSGRGQRWGGRPTSTASSEPEAESESDSTPPSSAVSSPVSSQPSSTVAESAIGKAGTASPTIDASSAAASSAVPPVSTGGSTTSNSTQTSSGDCSCGYILSAYDNAYFPKALVVSFDSVSSVAELANLGLRVQDGSQVGSIAPDGGKCQASADNVAIDRGILKLTVPGGQSAGGIISGAEIETMNPVLGGVFTMSAQLSPVHGTCQAIFTYTENKDLYSDEMDIEMVYIEPGLQLTNHDPSGSGLNDFENNPFPNDPTADFNDYTIGWFKDGPKYYYNGAVLTGPTQYPSVNPSKIVINNWSSGKPTFTQGPPDDDTVLQVKSIAYYYQTESLASYPAWPSGCSEADACVV